MAAITECTVSSSQECVRLIRHKIVPVDAVKEILEIHELLRARSIEIALPPLREGPDLSIAVHVSSQRDYLRQERLSENCQQHNRKTRTAPNPPRLPYDSTG
jgi:hypothetical protein